MTFRLAVYAFDMNEHASQVLVHRVVSESFLNKLLVLEEAYKVNC